MNIKKILFLIPVVLLACSSMIAQETTKPDENLIQTEMQSEILVEKRSVIIHLPRTYAKDPLKKYPVMYVLDGTSQDQHIADKIAVFSAAGMMPEFIVVGLPNSRGNRNRDQTPPFMQIDVGDAKSPLGKADGFLAFIEKELIPMVDKNYRTTDYRALFGHSRGALFVLYSLLEKPRLFDARFCSSAPVWRFEDLMIKKIDDFLKLKNLTKKTFLFLSAGAAETAEIVGGYNRLSELLKKRKNKKLIFVNYLTPFANHQENPLTGASKGLWEWSRLKLTN